MSAAFKSIIPHISPLERAIEDVAAAALARIDPEVITRIWDPDRCPAEHLWVLAHALSVDLWNDAWSEDKKRAVLRRWVPLKFSAGTYAGYRDFIDIVDGELRQVVAPPQGIYAAPGLTKEEWARWLALHPKVRITLSHGTAPRKARQGTFAGYAFAGWDFNGIDLSPALSGRRAYLVQNGMQTPLQLAAVETLSGQVTGRVEERITIRGSNLNGTFAGASWAGFSFAGACRMPKTYAVSLDRSYDYETSDLHLSTVPVGFEPRDTKYVRESEAGRDPFGIYAGRAYVSTRFATPDISGDLLADVLYLHDPEIASPKMAGISFAGFSRVGMPPHTAEFLIDMKAKAPRRVTFAGTGFVGRQWVAPDDPRRRRELLDAVRAAKRHSDKILVSFQTRRARSLDDGIPLDGSYQFGAMTANRL